MALLQIDNDVINPTTKFVIPAAAERRAGIQKRASPRQKNQRFRNSPRVW